MIALSHQTIRLWLARLFIITLVMFMLFPIGYLVRHSLTGQDDFAKTAPVDTFSGDGWRQLFGIPVIGKRSDSVYFRPGDTGTQSIGIEDGLSMAITPDGRLTIMPVEPWVLNYPPVTLRLVAEGLSNSSALKQRGAVLNVHIGSNVSTSETDVAALTDQPVYANLQMPEYDDNIDRIRVYYEYLWFTPAFTTETSRVMWNSIKLALSASAAVLIMSVLLAYALVRLKIAFKKQVTGLVLIAQMFPSFLLLTTYANVFYWLGESVDWLGRSSHISVFIIYLGSITLSVFLVLGYFRQVDADMEESAFIDGATPFQALWHILLPLSRPILAVTFMVSFVFFYSEFNISNRMLTFDNMTFAGFMMESSFYSNPPSLRAAMLLVSFVPVLILFLFIRKHLISGLAEGSTKG